MGKILDISMLAGDLFTELSMLEYEPLEKRSEKEILCQLAEEFCGERTQNTVICDAFRSCNVLCVVLIMEIILI